MSSDSNANNRRSKAGSDDGDKRKGRQRKKARKKPALDPAKYWGDATQLPMRTDYKIDEADATAVIRSLGKSPIPGKNSAPELYFEQLYVRAAGLAKVLAIAGGLNAETPESKGPGTSAAGTNEAVSAESNGERNATAQGTEAPVEDDTAQTSAGAPKANGSNAGTVAEPDVMTTAPSD